MSLLQIHLQEHVPGMRTIWVQAAVQLANWIYTADAPPPGLEVLRRVESSALEGQLTEFAVVRVEQLEAVFIVWRGSSSMSDSLADSCFLPQGLHSPNITGINVHTGISSLHRRDMERFLPAFKERLADLDEDWPIIFVGHSLGGGLAMLALLEFQLALADRSPFPSEDVRAHPREAYAVLFASPMVLSTAGVTDTAVHGVLETTARRAVNFVYGNDVVPRLPGNVEYLSARTLSGAIKSLTSSKLPIFGNLVARVATEGACKLLESSADMVCTAKQFRHICCLVHLLPSQVKVCEDGVLSDFSPTSEFCDPGSSVKDHSVQKYAKAIHQAAMLKAECVDDPNTIAHLHFSETKEAWLRRLLRGPSFTGDLEFRISSAGLGNFAEQVNPARTAAIVSFNGNSTNGKSFLIQKLQGEKQQAKPKVFATTDEEFVGATSGNVSLWHWDGGWLMDCEGTNGTDIPAVMGKDYRDISEMLRDTVTPGVRKEAVKKYIPPFALLTTNVFCYVTREGPNVLTAYQEVLDYANAAWSHVKNAVRPSLVVIQNQVGSYKDLKSFAQSTKLFQSKDGDGALAKMFLNVHFVQLPACDHDQVIKSINKSMGEVFEERLEELAKLLREEIENHHAAQEKHDVLVKQGMWLQVVERVVHGLQMGQPVSLSNVVTSIHIPDDQFFADVWDVFSFMFEKGPFDFKTKAQMVEHTLEVLRSVEVHAATLMARDALDCQLSPAKFKEKYSASWEGVLNQLEKNMPCCAEHATEAAPYKVCGQPKLGHDLHSSVIKKPHDNTWTTVWGPQSYVSIRWAGEHVLDQEIQDQLRQLQDSVFEIAAELSGILHQGSTDVSDRRIEKLRSWRKDHGLPPAVDRHCRHTRYPTLQFCYGCATTFKRLSFLEKVAMWWLMVREPGVDLCERCVRQFHNVLVAAPFPPMSTIAVCNPATWLIE